MTIDPQVACPHLERISGYQNGCTRTLTILCPPETYQLLWLYPLYLSFHYTNLTNSMHFQNLVKEPPTPMVFQTGYDLKPCFV